MPVLLFGWYFSYRALDVYLAFWLAAVAVALTAATAVARVFPWTGRADAIIRTGVVAFAIVVASAVLLLSLRRASPITSVGVSGALLICALAAGAPARDWWPRSDTTWVPAPMVGLCAALLAFVVGFGMMHSPMTSFDSLSYHLYFPGRWLQDQRLAIIATPFGDEAQAYAPANGELFFLWLMLPFHGDLIARIGQIPFVLLACVTVYALARRLGAPREQAVYPAMFLLLSRPVVEQSVGASVDVICATMFLASLYLGILAVDRNGRRDWLVFGASLGLYAGTKYLALPYLPIFLALAVARGARARSLWAVPGLAVFALPWYVRNWLVAGSPIYPAGLQVAGLSIARGAFTRAAMMNTVFHTEDPRLLLPVLAHAFGPTLFLCWLPCAAGGVARGLRRGWWPHAFVLLVPLVMLPLFWFGLPVNIDSRFLLPAVGPALLPLALTFGARRSWNAIVHALYAVAAVWIVVGVHASVPANLPWFMEGWLSLDGLVDTRFVLVFGAMAVGMGVCWRLVRHTSSWAPLASPIVVGLAAVTLGLGGQRWCGSPCDYIDMPSLYVPSDVRDAWSWVGTHVTRSTIAYTGNNAPYPLAGEQLTNRVTYVNIDGHVRWRLHDYDLAYRAGRFAPQPPVLAESSGELKPVSRRPGPRDDAVRPRYERLEGFRNLWCDNLQSLGVTHLFISSLSAYERDYVWHDQERFPIEEAWAREDPSVFHLLYQSPDVRIYSVVHPERSGA